MSTETDLECRHGSFQPVVWKMDFVESAKACCPTLKFLFGQKMFCQVFWNSVEMYGAFENTILNFVCTLVDKTCFDLILWKGSIMLHQRMTECRASETLCHQTRLWAIFFTSPKVIPIISTSVCLIIAEMKSLSLFCAFYLWCSSAKSSPDQRCLPAASSQQQLHFTEQQQP